MSCSDLKSRAKLRIAMVVQRYGDEVIGGAESHCRAYAEILAKHFEVEVLTSCALDYCTWEPHYDSGLSKIRGVSVRRFPAVSLRHPQFNRWWDIWRRQPRTRHDELRWLYEQGPVLPDLLSYLSANHDYFDLFIFFTYLYWPTAFGFSLVADRAILIPTANPGEPPMSFEIFRQLFRDPLALVYCTSLEREFVHQQFQNQANPNYILGVPLEEIISPDIGVFRRTHAIENPYILFMGRIGPSKGCDQLISDFIDNYLEDIPLTLVLAGTLEMSLPRHSSIRYVGPLYGDVKADALTQSLAIVACSPYDCLSIMTCEAWAAARPVLVTQQSPVVSKLVAESGGGASYANGMELSSLLNQWIRNPALVARMGKLGQKYVLQHYGRHSVEDRLVTLVTRIATEVHSTIR